MGSYANKKLVEVEQYKIMFLPFILIKVLNKYCWGERALQFVGPFFWHSHRMLLLYPLHCWNSNIGEALLWSFLKFHEACLEDWSFSREWTKQPFLDAKIIGLNLLQMYCIPFYLLTIIPISRIKSTWGKLLSSHHQGRGLEYNLDFQVYILILSLNSHLLSRIIYKLYMGLVELE